MEPAEIEVVKNVRKGEGFGRIIPIVHFVGVVSFILFYHIFFYNKSAYTLILLVDMMQAIR